MYEGGRLKDEDGDLSSSYDLKRTTSCSDTIHQQEPLKFRSLSKRVQYRTQNMDVNSIAPNTADNCPDSIATARTEHLLAYEVTGGGLRSDRAHFRKTKHLLPTEHFVGNNKLQPISLRERLANVCAGIPPIKKDLEIGHIYVASPSSDITDSLTELESKTMNSFSEVNFSTTSHAFKYMTLNPDTKSQLFTLIREPQKSRRPFGQTLVTNRNGICPASVRNFQTGYKKYRRAELLTKTGAEKAINAINLDLDKREKRPNIPNNSTWSYGEVHKVKWPFLSCCGACNLYPGVLIVAISMIVICSSSMALITYNEDGFKRNNSPFAFILGVLVFGCGFALGAFLLYVTLLDNGALLIIWFSMTMIFILFAFFFSGLLIEESCGRDHRLNQDGSISQSKMDRLEANLYCSISLFLMAFTLMLVYGAWIVASYIYFRFMRRAISIVRAKVSGAQNLQCKH